MAPSGLLLLLLIAAVGALCGGLMIGSIEVGPGDVWRSLTTAEASPARTIVLDLRVPRTLSAFGVGGLLAIAGVLMQVLLRNPLADPYVLGVSGGAAAAALCAMLIGVSGAAIDASAFAGAMAVTIVVFGVAHGSGNWTPVRLLLTGVVIASGLAAIISLLLVLSPDASLRGMLFWLMGDFSHAGSPAGVLALLLAAVVTGLAFARHLNLLARGDEQAALLGVPVVPLRAGIYVAGSLFTAIAVTTAGSIGFVGLVVPHLVRQLGGSDHRFVVPASALLGGALMVVADTVARTVVAPIQLPVGAFTALIGVPLFLMLLPRRIVSG